jgi:hypothetical protein
LLKTSDWYTTLGEYSFPTIFLRLAPDEIQALLASVETSACAKGVISRLQIAMKHLPGASFVGADVCAPTDSALYRKGRVSGGRRAWNQLRSSAKVCEAFRQGLCDRLIVRPFRTMDRAREFRMFIHDGQLVAMSQYCLDRHYKRLVKREKEIWQKGVKFAQQIGSQLPAPTLVADVYLTSTGRLLLVDLNQWGSPTDPLMLRTWDRDWETVAGLKLIPRPVRMKGDISVSF